VFDDLLGTIYPVCWMFFIIHFKTPAKRRRIIFLFYV